MPYFVGLDASKRATQICVIDESGAVVSEGVVPTEPKAFNNFLRGAGRRYGELFLRCNAHMLWIVRSIIRESEWAARASSTVRKP